MGAARASIRRPKKSVAKGPFETTKSDLDQNMAARRAELGEDSQLGDLQLSVLAQQLPRIEKEPTAATVEGENMLTRWEEAARQRALSSERLQALRTGAPLARSLRRAPGRRPLGAWRFPPGLEPPHDVSSDLR